MNKSILYITASLSVFLAVSAAWIMGGRAADRRYDELEVLIMTLGDIDLEIGNCASRHDPFCKTPEDRASSLFNSGSYEDDLNFVMRKLNDDFYRIDVLLKGFSNLQAADTAAAKRVKEVLSEEAKELKELLLYRGHMSGRSDPPRSSRILLFNTEVYSDLYKLRDEAKQASGVHSK